MFSTTVFVMAATSKPAFKSKMHNVSYGEIPEASRKNKYVLAYISEDEGIKGIYQDQGVLKILLWKIS